MPLVSELDHKRQTKMNDCWYACTQKLLSWRAGSKPMGVAVAQHRSPFAVGRKLGFGSAAGGHIMRENDLVAIGNELDTDDIGSVQDLLLNYGPFIVGGKFGPCKAGHFVVICGVNPRQRTVYRDNPGWGYGKAWKPLSYLKNVWTYRGSTVISAEAVIALRPLAA